MLSQDVKTDATIAIDVRMEDFGFEGDLQKKYGQYGLSIKVNKIIKCCINEHNKNHTTVVYMVSLFHKLCKYTTKLIPKGALILLLTVSVYSNPEGPKKIQLSKGIHNHDCSSLIFHLRE